jgi:hypothetical protein
VEATEVEPEAEVEVEEASEEDKKMEPVMKAILAGVDPGATPAERAEMKRLSQVHFDYVGDLVEGWATSGNEEDRRKAQMIVGYMQLEIIANGNDDNGTNDDDERVPQRAPTSIHALLNANQRAKLERLALSVADKYANDFYCRKKVAKT